VARRKPIRPNSQIVEEPEYGGFVAGLSELLEHSRRTAARAVNSVLTATYWEIGRRIVEFEQWGKARAAYGEALIERLAKDLTAKYGRGFSCRNLQQMRSFYLSWQIFQTPSGNLEARTKLQALSGESPWRTVGATSDGHDSSEICQTPSGDSVVAEKVQTPSAQLPSTGTDLKKVTARKTRKAQTVSAQSPACPPPVPDFPDLIGAFPLSWSHYTRLMSVEKPHARVFYESEAIRGGWSVRQLDRQIGTQFFERTSASRRQEAMLARGQQPQPDDAISARDEVRDPYLLEFLDLKDEYSETELEEAIIHRLEWFLLELGTGFAFIARQKRIRVGDKWYRIDLLLYHRGLRCLVIIDLKTGPFTHADAGQMNLYLNYAKEHLTLADEADPVGIILCAHKNDAVVKYATGGIGTQVFATKYLTRLPDEQTLRREILATQRALEHRAAAKKEHP